MITPEKIDENGRTAGEPIHIAQEHLHDRRSMNNLPHDDDTAKNRETRDVVNKHTLPDHVMKIGDDLKDCVANKHHVMTIGDDSKDCVASKHHVMKLGDVANKHTLPDHVMKIGDDSIDCGANKHHVMKIGDCVANKTNF